MLSETLRLSSSCRRSPGLTLLFPASSSLDFLALVAGSLNAKEVQQLLTTSRILPCVAIRAFHPSSVVLLLALGCQSVSAPRRFLELQSSYAWPESPNFFRLLAFETLEAANFKPSLCILTCGPGFTPLLQLTHSC